MEGRGRRRNLPVNDESEENDNIDQQDENGNDGGGGGNERRRGDDNNGGYNRIEQNDDDFDDNDDNNNMQQQASGAAANGVGAEGDGDYYYYDRNNRTNRTNGNQGSGYYDQDARWGNGGIPSHYQRRDSLVSMFNGFAAFGSAVVGIGVMLGYYFMPRSRQQQNNNNNPSFRRRQEQPQHQYDPTSGRRWSFGSWLSSFTNPHHNAQDPLSSFTPLNPSSSFLPQPSIPYILPDNSYGSITPPPSRNGGNSRSRHRTSSNNLSQQQLNFPFNPSIPTPPGTPRIGGGGNGAGNGRGGGGVQTPIITPTPPGGQPMPRPNPPYVDPPANPNPNPNPPARRKLTPREQLWRIILTLALLCLLTVFLTVPFPKSWTEGVIVGDRKVVEIPSSWYEAVIIHSVGEEKVDAFLLETRPSINESLRFPQKVIAPEIEDGSYHYVRYDLYSNSKVKINWLFNRYNTAPSFMVLAGENNFRTFEDGQDIPEYGVLYETKSAQGIYTFVSPYRSEFYFIFFGDKRKVSATGTASFDVTATTVNLKQLPPYALHCFPSDISRSPGCRLPLFSTAGTSFLVLSHSPNSTTADARLSLQAKGRAQAYFNLWFWVAVIIAGVVISGLALGELCLCYCCRGRGGSNGGGRGGGGGGGSRRGDGRGRGDYERVDDEEYGEVDREGEGRDEQPNDDWIEDDVDRGRGRNRRHQGGGDAARGRRRGFPGSVQPPPRNQQPTTPSPPTPTPQPQPIMPVEPIGGRPPNMAFPPLDPQQPYQPGESELIVPATPVPIISLQEGDGSAAETARETILTTPPSPTTPSGNEAPPSMAPLHGHPDDVPPPYSLLGKE